MVIGKNHNRPGGLAIVVDSLLPYSLYLKTTKKGKLEYQRDELRVHLIQTSACGYPCALGMGRKQAFLVGGREVGLSPAL